MNPVARYLWIIFHSDTLTVVAGAVLSLGLAEMLGQTLLLLRRQPKSYSERLATLTASLTRASSEVDEVLREIAQIALERQAALMRLEGDLAGLEGREKELKERIEVLQNTPLPVAEHFAKLLELGERRTRRRDYLLFGAGVVVTTALTLVLRSFSR